ncbi:isocitrate/isopropylmalate family dehydrogenase, partial [Hydrogenibacillus schlegelii]|uniref:isocitrate/isopropylmalate family dehydrogenase n=1 Tax=Hydrogenibacillus schlegelii TaxID=1484 RepID=UPI002353DB2A
MSKTYRIAAIPGDGIGPEVLEIGMEVLTAAVNTLSAGRLQFDLFPWGSEYYLQHGRMMPENALEILKAYDAIYLGAIGDPRVPDHLSLEMLLDLRKGFDQYVNLRPVKLLPGVESPVRLKPGETVDFVVVRENTEGEYSRLGGRFKVGTADEVAVQTSIFTRKGKERVMRYAFDLARRRAEERAREGVEVKEGGGTAGGPRPMVTNCTKSNALNYSMVFWDE